MHNSGSIFVLSALSEIGWFNTSYFVDGVDYEFSLRSHLDDYKIGCVEGVPDFDHESEQGNRSYNIWGIVVNTRKYPIKRVKDVIGSSLRLILTGIVNLKFKFTIEIFRQVTVFVVLQFLIRLFR